MSGLARGFMRRVVAVRSAAVWGVAVLGVGLAGCDRRADAEVVVESPAVAEARAQPSIEGQTEVEALAEAAEPETDTAALEGARDGEAECGEPVEGMSCVPGGAFTRGRDDGPDNERPALEVRVSSFLLDRLEVSNARYAECVEAGECQRQMHFPGYMGATQPAVAMRWVDADAYCRWRGGRLPTEAEWERAARGPGSGLYPWGDDPGQGCEHAVVLTREGRGCGGEVTQPVGSRPAGPYGLYDMAGNVWEWVSDHHAFCYRGCPRECGAACEGLDPQGPCGDAHAECPASLGHRTVRGGSWWYRIDRATTTARRGVPGANPNPHRFGFRCARDARG